MITIIKSVKIKKYCISMKFQSDKLMKMITSADRKNSLSMKLRISIASAMTIIFISTDALHHFPAFIVLVTTVSGTNTDFFLV